MLIPGVELTNEYEKYHILAVDIKEYVDPTLPIEEIIQCLHEQDALAIACHPHRKDPEGNQPYMHVWDTYKNTKRFDAWEIGNKNDLFNATDQIEFNFVANSDFHRLSDIYSWKTMVRTEKNIHAIKENHRVAIHLFRDNRIQLRQQMAQVYSNNGIVCEPLTVWP